MTDIFAEPDLAASPRRCVKGWRAHGYRVSDWQHHGPAGFRFILGHDAPYRVGSVIVSQSELEDGHEWIHASLAWSEVMPTYQELTVLHQSVFGHKRYAYQVFAPVSDHVNIHRHALHLWGRADGRPALPEFGAWGSI